MQSQQLHFVLVKLLDAFSNMTLEVSWVWWFFCLVFWGLLGFFWFGGVFLGFGVFFLA